MIARTDTEMQEYAAMVQFTNLIIWCANGGDDARNNVSVLVNGRLVYLFDLNRGDHPGRLAEIDRQKAMDDARNMLWYHDHGKLEVRVER